MKSPIIKLNDIVEDSLKKHKNGKEFFYQIDSEIRKSENEDIILELFEKIYNKFGFNYNLVVSGSFSDHILHLIRRGKISCYGTILQLSGSITSHHGEIGKITPDKEIIVQYKNEDYSNKDFIFVDDSYFSGTTEFKINEFLGKVGSKIIQTYIIYDGGVKNKNKISLYRYFDHHKGSEHSVKNLLDYLHKIKDIPYRDFENRIVRGDIKTIFDLKNKINDFYTKVGREKINVFQRNESKTIKENINNETSYLLQVFSEMMDDWKFEKTVELFFPKNKVIHGGSDNELKFGRNLRIEGFCNNGEKEFDLIPKENIYLFRFMRYQHHFNRSFAKDDIVEIDDYLEDRKEYLEGDGYKLNYRVTTTGGGCMVTIIIQENRKVNEMKSWKMFLESVDSKLDVSYLKNVFSEFGDEWQLRCVQSEVVGAKSYFSDEDVNEYREILTHRPWDGLSHQFGHDKFSTTTGNGILAKKETLLLKYYCSYGFKGDTKIPPSKEEKEYMKEYVQDMKEYLEGDGYLVEYKCSMNSNERSIGDGIQRFQIFIFIVIQKA